MCWAILPASLCIHRILSGFPVSSDTELQSGGIKLVCCFSFETGLCISGFQLSVAEDDLKFWGCHSTHLFQVLGLQACLLGTKPRASWMLDKHSYNQAISPALFICQWCLGFGKPREDCFLWLFLQHWFWLWWLCLGRTQDGETALQLAIKNQLPLVVDAICTRGADMSVPDEKGNPPLWLALASNLEDIASTLVSHR